MWLSVSSRTAWYTEWVPGEWELSQRNIILKNQKEEEEEEEEEEDDDEEEDKEEKKKERKYYHILPRRKWKKYMNYKKSVETITQWDKFRGRLVQQLYTIGTQGILKYLLSA